MGMGNVAKSFQMWDPQGANLMLRNHLSTIGLTRPQGCLQPLMNQ